MECVGTVLDEVTGRQLVTALDGDVRKVFGRLLYLEPEGGAEGGVTTEGMAKAEMIGLHGIWGEQETADGGDKEEVGAFEERRSGMATTGRTVADEEAGDVALDESLVEVGEQMGEA